MPDRWEGRSTGCRLTGLFLPPVFCCPDFHTEEKRRSSPRIRALCRSDPICECSRVTVQTDPLVEIPPGMIGRFRLCPTVPGEGVEGADDEKPERSMPDGMAVGNRVAPDRNAPSISFI